MPKIDVLLNGSPLRTTEGVVGFCSVVLIEGQKRTLVDVGHVGRRVALQEALEQRGLTPKDIDLTIMSHAHWDHSQNYDLFTHAPMLVHSYERKYAHHPHANDWATPAWSGAMIEFQPDIQEVDEGYEIEPGVRLMHTPGHSPGSLSVMVETDDGLCAVTGDVLHYANVALSRRNPLVFWNEKEATQSIDRLLGEADLIPSPVIIVWMVNLASSQVKTSPLCHLMSSSKLIVMPFRSEAPCQSLARSGTMTPD